jgi:CBS domain containing-hemolysin-like protein
MSHIYKEAPNQQPLTTFKAPQGTGYSEPSTFTLVRADSPAMCVMTDFKQVSVATIGPEATLGQANQTMISRGVRLLLVINRDEEVIGLITSRDTSGEKPIQMVQERGGKYADLLVRDLMCPRERIDLLDTRDVLTAKVGDIVATMKHFKRQHLMAGERDPISGKVRIRGVFSATQIGRQLGAAIQTFDVGSTFSEIEGLLSQDNA